MSSCPSQDAKVSRDIYQQLAREIAGYAISISHAAQLDQRILSVALSPRGDLQNQRDVWIREVHKLTSVFGQVREMIDQRQVQDNQRRSELLDGAPCLRYDALHIEDDKEEVARLREKIEGRYRLVGSHY